MNKIKTKLKWLLFYIYFSVAVIAIIAGGLNYWYLICLNYFPVFEVAEVNIIRKAEAVEAKENMREWVLNEFKRNGLNTQIADCVINQESRWDDQRISPSREDFGLMQWHIQHVRSGLIKPSCAFDYHCAVNMAIKKLKQDGDWHAWYGYRDANCQRFGKI